MKSKQSHHIPIFTYFNTQIPTKRASTHTKINTSNITAKIVKMVKIPTKPIKTTTPKPQIDFLPHPEKLQFHTKT
jgi:hypothetical protein